MSRSRLKVRVLAVVAALFVFGCGEVDNRVDVDLSATSDFQREILSDGVVTLEEMAGAAQAYVDCVSEPGDLVGSATFDSVQETFVYRFAAIDDESDPSEILARPVNVDCDRSFKSEVELVWADQTGPTPAEEERFYESVAGCMADKGYEVTGASPRELDRLIQQSPEDYRACFAEALE